MRARLLTKPDKWGNLALDVAQAIFGKQNVLWDAGKPGDPLPEGLGLDGCDVLLSFLNNWIVPAGVLASYKHAINFHPGPVEYPGIGCYNFAIYDGAKEYGVIAHRMVAAVDAGPIIVERRFDIGPGIDVASLKLRSATVLLEVLHTVCTVLTSRFELPQDAGVYWLRKPYTRKDLEALCRITDDMAPDEALRRIHATYFPGMPGAYIEKFGREWRLPFNVA